MSDWLVCDKGICLYNEHSLKRLKTDVPRCIKHGAILTDEPQLRSLPRAAARKVLNAWREGGWVRFAAPPLSQQRRET